ncbi:hypothetical protein ACTOV4_10185 [Brucella sp. C7-11G]
MNFYEKEDFDRVVYTIDYEKDGYPIIEHRLGDIVREYAEPGSGGRDAMFVEGVELYSHDAGPCRWRELVWTFDTEDEANHALLLCHRFNMYEKMGTSWEHLPEVYDTREAAEEWQAEMLEEDAENDDEPVAPSPAS